ncbi:MAG: NADH-quinone oxidoreductase subunit B [Deltaproteobacteria bacterium]|nr:NADH-quinone oxidoreductase subunit B [Deltaproteobacteria bacterium]
MGTATGAGRPGSIILASIDEVMNWGRKNSLWYLLFATACCGIELMQTGGPRTDLDRFGVVFRASPRQADFMIIAGTITYKMASRVRRLYEQMAEPKWVVSMGSCANCGGLFVPSYSVLKGVDQVIPVDVYIPGCPPRPEALAEGILKLREKVGQERRLSGGPAARPSDSIAGGPRAG